MEWIETHLAIMNTLNTTTPIGSARRSPTGYLYLRSQVFFSAALEAPNSITVERTSIPESITEAKSDMELEYITTITLSARRTMF